MFCCERFEPGQRVILRIVVHDDTLPLCANEILRVYREQWCALGLGVEVPIHHFINHSDQAEGQLDPAALRDPDSVVECLGEFGKQHPHLLLRFEVEFLRLKGHGIGLVHRGVGLDADKEIGRAHV